MTDYLVRAVLIYLLMGTLIFAFLGPATYADFVTKWWAKRKGELPTAGFQAWAVLTAIMMGPVLVVTTAIKWMRR